MKLYVFVINFSLKIEGFCRIHNTIYMNYFVSQTMKDVSRLLKYSVIIQLKAKYVWQNMLAAREKSKRDGEFSFLEHDSEGEIFTTYKKMKLLYSYKLKQSIIVLISSISQQVGFPNKIFICIEIESIEYLFLYENTNRLIILWWWSVLYYKIIWPRHLWAFSYIFFEGMFLKM